jgi:hypothetical protein
MNLCDECQTAAHCLRNGCIPITEEPAPVTGARVRRFFRLLMLSAFNPMHPDLWEAKRAKLGDGDTRALFLQMTEARRAMLGPNIIFAPAPLKFPEIDPNLLPTKETTA